MTYLNCVGLQRGLPAEMPEEECGRHEGERDQEVLLGVRMDASHEAIVFVAQRLDAFPIERIVYLVEFRFDTMEWYPAA